MKVATYCRISTDESRQPFSLGAQAERLDAYIYSQEGWALTRKYEDQFTGKNLDRPGLQQALGDAKQGLFDLFLVYKVDRLARSISGLVQILEDLQKANVVFRSATEPFDTSSAAGRMMVQLLGVFAEFERELIVERTKMGLARKAAKGEWTGGKAPYGYRYDSDSRLLVPMEDEASVVLAMFEKYVLNGMGSVAIANWLNDASELTRNGSYWTPSRVIGVLRNPTYVGTLPFNGQVFDSLHEPIVDRDLFERATALLDKRAADRGKRRSNSTDYVLTGFLRCK